MANSSEASKKEEYCATFSDRTSIDGDSSVSVKGSSSSWYCSSSLRVTLKKNACLSPTYCDRIEIVDPERKIHSQSSKRFEYLQNFPERVQIVPTSSLLFRGQRYEPKTETSYYFCYRIVLWRGVKESYPLFFEWRRGLGMGSISSGALSRIQVVESSLEVWRVIEDIYWIKDGGMGIKVYSRNRSILNWFTFGRDGEWDDLFSSE